MAKLVIVESPKKIKPIKEYLGRGYEVVASNGHVRDLPKSTLGVDVEHDFTPKYITQRGKSDVIKKLKAAAKDAKFVYLATDPDREGEAISWHLAHLLNLDMTQKNRVTFSEITKTGITQGMKQPRTIDLKLVDAQQTRRVLDRLVGYKMSPFLWKKVRAGLSAGRVQSVVVRLIVDREDEIEAFVPEEFWTLDALLHRTGEESFAAKLTLVDGKKADPKTKEEADAIAARLENAAYTVSAVKRSKKKKNPLPPFITSTLQQEASRRLGFASRKTMSLAQELYEGVTLKDGSSTGLITYMRTDSLRLSVEATDAARAYIEEAYGAEYLPPKANVYINRNKAQDAHEAIRPSTPSLTPKAVKESLSRDQYRLYKLIWERFIACQMVPAVYNTVTADIDAAGCTFRSSGQSVAFRGFEELYNDKSEESASNMLPDLQEKDRLEKESLTCNQHFTQPPARYNEASIIKAMEEYGIGRPSTYATIISTILARDYVEREGKNLIPTPLGRITTEQIEEHFAKIVDVEFTAHMENELDRVEQGERSYEEVLSAFYGDFAACVEEAMATVGDEKIELPVEESDVICEKCGRRMVYKTGRYGRFLACPGFPECRNTKAIVVEAPGACPVCGSKMAVRKSKKGRTYYSCTNYPACKFMSWDEPIDEVCPKCGKHLFAHKGKQPRVYCADEACGYEKLGGGD